MRQLAPQGGSDIAVSAASLKVVPNDRTLLFVGQPEVLSGAVAAAIQREFPFLRVLQSTSLQAALDDFEAPLRLILVDELHAHELREFAAELLSQNPAASIAIVTDSDLRGNTERFQMIDTRQVQGVLPLNVSLDVLLSMLRIILRGGTYFPSMPYVYSDGVDGRNDRQGGADGSEPRPGEDLHGKVMHQLTKRENEILGKISQGNQNKIIAAALGLSEHTVKIHIHNIITKLGVHNRTEAVALYFEQRAAGGSGAENIVASDHNSSAGNDG